MVACPAHDQQAARELGMNVPYLRHLTDNDEDNEQPLRAECSEAHFDDSSEELLALSESFS